MLKAIGRSAAVQRALGHGLASYLRLVKATNRFAAEPADYVQRLAEEAPLIGAMWHGQHLMASFAWPPVIGRVGALVSRSNDAEIQAAALRSLGVEPIRGSGGGPRVKREKGGAAALLEMARALRGGVNIVMTADSPKVPRVCGLGIVTLAKLSGRPIAAVAVATSRRFDFNSWDRASIGKPFGTGAMVIGEIVHVARDASDGALEEARLKVQASLDAVHARAYQLVGARDPGRDLRTP